MPRHFPGPPSLSLFPPTPTPGGINYTESHQAFATYGIAYGLSCFSFLFFIFLHRNTLAFSKTFTNSFTYLSCRPIFNVGSSWSPRLDSIYFHISLRFSDIYVRFGDRPINKRHQATTSFYYLSTTISHSPGQRRRTHARAAVFITA